MDEKPFRPDMPKGWLDDFPDPMSEENKQYTFLSENAGKISFPPNNLLLTAKFSEATIVVATAKGSAE